MKKILLYCLVLTSINCACAQEIPRRTLEDSVIGWIKVYNFKGIKEGQKIGHRVYSAAQLSLCDSFANWMQASYLPKGGLGDIKKIATEKLGLYNQHTAGLPPSYGASALTYYFLKYNSNRKLTPATSHNVAWEIVANGVPAGWGIRDICTPTQYYFTMPSLEEYDGGEAMRKLHDLSNIPTLKPYSNFWVKNVEAGGGTDNILLSKDNKSPFIKITKAEYLQLLEAAIPVVLANEKKKLSEAEQGNQKNIAFFGNQLDVKSKNRYEALKKIREKYKDRLGELAFTNIQPSLSDLDNGMDIFANGYLTDQDLIPRLYPVYKIDPAMAELCKKDKPQWILVSWWWSANDLLEKNLHESIINNFNFSYLYDFVFAPEKIKGQSYKPLRSPAFSEAIVITQASANSQKILANKNTFFFEDFSTTAVGKKPVGWNSRLNSNGKSCIVTTLKGLDGNWAELEGNEEFVPIKLKKPFPQNFTLSYELAVPKNFTWGGKGLAFQLSKETSPRNAESFVNLSLRPGFDGRDGEAVIETKFTSPPGYLNGTKWLKAPGFSNDKNYNRIAVTVKKIDETLQVFIDDTKIANYEKAIPSALLFNAMSFTHGRSDAETEKYYITNIKIVKE